MSNNLAILTTIIGLIINGVGLIFIATQVAVARQELRHNLILSAREAERVKRQATIESYMATMQRVAEWRSVLPDDWDQPAIEAYTRRACRPGGKAKARVLANYLQYYEALSVAVLSGIYDRDAIDAIGGSRIINIADNYQTFFTKRRREVGANTAYRNIEELARQLREHRRSIGYRHIAESIIIPADEEPTGHTKTRRRKASITSTKALRK
jgi:hypothetical protein